MADTPELSENKKKALEHFTGKPPVQEEKTSEEKTEVKEEIKNESTEKKESEEQEGKKEEVAPAKPTQVELTDEQLLEIASKKAGRPIKSWDELKLSPTEEDKRKAEEARDSEKLSFGLQKGLFNKKQYAAFISDSKDPKDLVYSRELAAAKKDDAEWDEQKEADFKEEFEVKFGLNLDESSTKHKRGIKQLTMIADNILKTDYASIYSLDAEYSKHETDQANITAQQQKILKEAPIYKQNVEAVVGALSKVEMDFGGEKYEVPIPKETLDSLTEDLMNSDFAAAQISKGYTKEELQTVARQYIIHKNYNHLSFEAAKLYRAQHEKGVHGIPEKGKIEKEVAMNENLTPEQQKALDFFRIKENPVNAN